MPHSDAFSRALRRHRDIWLTRQVHLGQHHMHALFPVHGLRDPQGKGDTPARAAQTQRIAEVFGRLWRPGMSGVLAGDFNLLPDSECFDVLSGAGLHDMIAHHGITDTRTALYTKDQRFADYMLVSPDLIDAHFDVPAAPEVSDHRPLILTL